MFFFSLRHSKIHLFANQFDWWCHKIRENKILTFVNVLLDSEGENDDDSQKSVPVATFDDEALSFTHIPHKEKSFGLMPQSITMEVIPDVESLPELEDGGLAMVRDPQVELLSLHYWVNHFGFRNLQILAKLGVLLKRLSTVMPPKCAACICVTTHKQPWQMQTQASNVCIFPITLPGQCIYINQMIFQNPVFCKMEGTADNLMI